MEKNVDRFDEVLFCMKLFVYWSKIIYEVFLEFGLKIHIGVDGKKSKSEAMYFPGVRWL